MSTGTIMNRKEGQKKEEKKKKQILKIIQFTKTCPPPSSISSFIPVWINCLPFPTENCKIALKTTVYYFTSLCYTKLVRTE